MKNRRLALASIGSVAIGLVVSGCGFRLRGATRVGVSRVAVLPNPGGAVAVELRQSFGDEVHVLGPQEPLTQAQVIIDIVGEQREKVVVGTNSSGGVREFQLRSKVLFKMRTPQGQDLVPESEIIQQRGLSYTESAALSKEAEEALLYKDMQTDLVQQLIRRLAVVAPRTP